MVGLRAILVSGVSVGLLAMSATAALAAPSKADTAAAQRLFDEGLSLMEAKRYAEACPRLLQSQKLDPGMGTKFRLAECYEAAGLTGSAWRLFTEVAAEARAAGRADRAGQAASKAEALKSKVPFVTLQLAPSVASAKGLSLSIDGEPLPGADVRAPIPVDPGARKLALTADGKGTFEKSFRALEGGTEQIAVRELPDAGLGSQRIVAIVVGAFGLASVGTGIGVGLLAKSTWDDALVGCSGGVTTKCTDEAIDQGRHAELYSHLSTAAFVVGGVAIAVAPILFFTAPSGGRAVVSTAAVVPLFGDGFVGLAVRGGLF